jgi:hypothetical protein
MTTLRSFASTRSRSRASEGLDENETIDLFLHATALGLFGMDWLLICPRCACAVESFTRLRAVLRRFRCPECRHGYEAAMMTSSRSTSASHLRSARSPTIVRRRSSRSTTSTRLSRPRAPYTPPATARAPSDPRRGARRSSRRRREPDSGHRSAPRAPQRYAGRARPCAPVRRPGRPRRSSLTASLMRPSGSARNPIRIPPARPAGKACWKAFVRSSPMIRPSGTAVSRQRVMSSTSTARAMASRP